MMSGKTIIDIIGMAKHHGVHCTPNFTISLMLETRQKVDEVKVGIDDCVLKLAELSLTHTIRDVAYGYGNIMIYLKNSKDFSTNINLEVLDLITSLKENGR